MTHIDRRRDEFPTLQAGAYLMSHSLGPIPRAAADAMKQYLDAWQSHTSEDAWASSWWELSAQVGDRYARIIGADEGTVLPTYNATLAAATVASCLDYADRPTVITTELDFPSMGYFWNAQKRRGAKIRIVPSDNGITTPVERILDAIDETTAIVAVSHTSYCSSYRLDGRALVERAHEVGALALLDIYQSAGVVEIDAQSLGADFLIGGSIKWLCGGPASGFLHVRPGLINQLEPTITGWIAHENPFAFDADLRYDKTIRRFSNGTPSIPSLYSVIPGMDLIESVGVDAIAAESRVRTQRIVVHAMEQGWPLNSPTDANQRGGTVMLSFDDPESLAGTLRNHQVFVDWRPGVGIRISPHFFNTDDEITAALDAIGQCVNA